MNVTGDETADRNTNSGRRTGRTRKLVRILLTLGTGLLLTVGFAPSAFAGTYVNTYLNLSDCQAEGQARVAAAGGTFSGTTYDCQTTYGVGPGVAGCPATAEDGCIGTYYVLRTYSL